MHIIELLYYYSYIPSTTVLVLAIMVFISWVFGTDTFDTIRQNTDDGFFEFFGVNVGVSLFLVLLRLTPLAEWDLIQMVDVIFNTWLVFNLICVISVIFWNLMIMLRNYCLMKRGKK